MGDSLAYEEAPAVVAALGAAGLDVATYAYPGVSLAGDEFLPDGESWIVDHHAPTLVAHRADVVFWQLALFDTIYSPDLLLERHREFADVALWSHDALVFVLPPAIVSGSVPYSPGWEPVVDIAEQVAAEHPGEAFIVDPVEVWGEQFVRFAPNGLAIRKPDGVHTCQWGGLALGVLLAHWLAARFGGVQAVERDAVPTDWWDDSRFDQPSGACDPLPAPSAS